ncbi:MAG: hypothetical protein LBH74_08200 [Nitrososphaerota archaeon]|nr:hypothetical protein [Nitrososphaerota archaeon]
MKKISLLIISLVALTILLSSIFTSVTLGAPAGNHIKDHDVWDPALSTLSWVHGNAKGYSEGQTAAFRVTIDDTTAGQTLWFIVELDLNASGAYAFTDIKPWDTTHQQDGTHLQPPPLDSSLTDNRDGFNAVGAVINEVNFLGYSNGYQSWNVTLTATTAPGPIYVIYGGHIAASGDPIASGGTVPLGSGASHIKGVFQARINSPGTGAKTINFNANAINEKISQSITVTKITLPQDTTTTANFITSAPQKIFSLTGNLSWDTGDLSPGNYTITELAQADWDLTNIVVFDPDFGSVVDLETGTVTVDLDPGEHITIIFINTAQQSSQNGLFVVEKLTVPLGALDSFDFVTSVSGEGFSLTDNERWYSGELDWGIYTITELAQVGWDLTDIIVEGTPNYVADLETGTVIIGLNSNEYITIIFINTAQQTHLPGSFTVTKQTSPSEVSTSFNFITSASSEGFALANGYSWSSPSLSPGNYTLTEIAQAGWDLTNIIISDPTHNSYVDLSTGTVFIAIDPGETITILYQNTQQAPDMGSFSVTKVSCPGGSSESFRFVTSAPDGSFSLTDGSIWSSGMLPPGNYTVTELVPPGWEIANILLDDPSGTSSVDLSTGTAIINLQAGTHISIVYQDAHLPSQGGSISVVKTTCPTDTSAVFSFVSSASEGAFSLGNGEVWNSGELVPGRYFVTEVLQAGWIISDIVIVDPSGTSTADLSTGTAFINLQAGTHVTILYQNTEQTRPDCNCNKNPCQCKPICTSNQPPCKPKTDCNKSKSECTPKSGYNKPQFPSNPQLVCTSLSVGNFQDLRDDIGVEICDVVQVVEENLDRKQTETDNTKATTEAVSTETQPTPLTSSSISSGSLTSSSVSSSQMLSSHVSNSAASSDTPLFCPVPSSPSTLDPASVLTQVPAEGSVMFGLGPLGAMLVILLGASVTVLAITTNINRKKRRYCNNDYEGV